MTDELLEDNGKDTKTLLEKLREYVNVDNWFLEISNDEGTQQMYAYPYLPTPKMSL